MQNNLSKEKEEEEKKSKNLRKNLRKIYHFGDFLSFRFSALTKLKNNKRYEISTFAK